MKFKSTMMFKLFSALTLCAVILLAPGRSFESEQLSEGQIQGITIPSFDAKSGSASAPEFTGLNLPPQITASSAMVFDAKSGVILFTHNFDEPVSIASLTKIMTALVANEHLRPKDMVVVEPSDIKIVGNNMGLKAGETISVENLTRGLLILSGNDAAKTLARAAGGSEEEFVKKMNEKAAGLGMAQTSFSNPVGLDSSRNYSTASDLSILVKEFLKHKNLANAVGIKETTVTSKDGKITHKLTSTNKLLWENEKFTGIKTGFTSLAKGSLITKMDDRGREIITIVLGSDNRESDTKTLIEWVFSTYMF
jgi:serine-type D-Ala-D-Ala carboxypeptidase (penicillin-binding protein 5/6)